MVNLGRSDRERSRVSEDEHEQQGTGEQPHECPPTYPGAAIMEGYQCYSQKLFSSGFTGDIEDADALDVV